MGQPLGTPIANRSYLEDEFRAFSPIVSLFPDWSVNMEEVTGSGYFYPGQQITVWTGTDEQWLAFCANGFVDPLSPGESCPVGDDTCQRNASTTLIVVSAFNQTWDIIRGSTIYIMAGLFSWLLILWSWNSLLKRAFNSGTGLGHRIANWKENREFRKAGWRSKREYNKAIDRSNKQVSLRYQKEQWKKRTTPRKTP
jgi:hypothetical protein